MKNTLEQAVNYFYVGVFPNSFATFLAYQGISNACNGNLSQAKFQLFVAVCNYFVGFLKFCEYVKVKSALEELGWDDRIVKPKMYSHCQRHLSRQAAKQTGYLNEFDKFARREGHKWYHVLPKIHRFDEAF